jgi:hypothetical protein
VLGAESLSVQFRHIARYLLWFCSEKPENKDILNNVIVAVGYFTLNSAQHQVIII